MKPFRVQEELLKEFEMYIYTTFPILDEELKKKITEKVKKERLLWKDVYISLDKDYIMGLSIDKMVANGIIDAKTGEIFKKYGITELYSHQQTAAERIVNGENTIVATGTGSGKTEAFLLPVIDYCIKNPDKQGTKAIIIYPMNALANDQYERLKKMLKDTEISFGMYTSATPILEEDGPTSALPNERATRQEIQNNPPDILLTNYAMLEYLLIRKEDRKIFQHKSLRFMVLDEIHTYTGARGAEIAMLLRRLKEHSVGPNAKIVHIGTSATVSGGEEGKKEVIRFASSFFGDDFDDDSVVFEKYIESVEPEDNIVPDSPSGLDQVQVDPSDEEKVSELASQVLGIVIEGNVFENLYDELGKYRITYLIKKYLSDETLTLTEMAVKLRSDMEERADEELGEIENEIMAYLILGVAAIKNEKRFFRPKLHLFLRGMHGLVRCSSCGEIYPAGVETCQKCGSNTYPLEVCRHCGKDFLRTIQKSEPEGVFLKPFDAFESEEKTYHITRTLETLFEDDDTTPTNVTEVLVCESCGFSPSIGEGFSEGDDCPICGKKLMKFKAVKGKLTQCPVCHGTYGNREVVTPIKSFPAPDVSIITTSLLSNMEEDERQLLIFSDNRQDAAHQAGYMGDRHVKFTLRQLIYSIAKESSEALDIEHMRDAIFEKGQELKILSEPKSRSEEKDMVGKIEYDILEEITSVPSLRNTLEALGLITVNYYRLENLKDDERFKEISNRFGIDEETLLKFLKIFLNEMRFRGAISHKYFISRLDASERRRMGIIRKPHWKPTGYGFTKVSGKKYYEIKPFSHSGKRALFDVIINNLFGGEVDSYEFIKEIVDLLEDKRYIVQEKIGYKEQSHKAYVVEYRRIELIIPEKLWKCKSCNKVHTENINNKCTTYNCKGTLEEYFPDNRNYYVYHYTSHSPISINVGEHSGQIPNERREKYERDFKEKKMNVLVCTPTLELGIDVGDLSSLILRNVPPSPSNYAQRAGRAGRRTGISLSVVYTRGTYHDSYFYEKPPDIISGKIIPPVFKLDNEKIIKRHVRSFILEKIDYKLPSTLGELIVESGGKYSVRDMETMRRSIYEKRSDIKRGLRTVLERDAKDFDFLKGKSLDDYVDKVIDNFVDDFKESLSPFISLLTEIKKRTDMLYTKSGRTKQEKTELKRLLDLQDKLTGDKRVAYTYTYLTKVGFLPGYAFPGAQTQLILSDSRTDPIVRDIEFAITEYAPGNIVYVDKVKYRPSMVTLTEEVNAAEYVQGHVGMHYKHCTNCSFATSDLSMTVCPHCNAELSEAIHCFEPRLVRADRIEKVSASEEYRRSASFDVEKYLLENEDEVSGNEILLKGNIRMEHRRDARILITNQGRKGEKFALCLKCGSWTSEENFDRWVENHSRYCEASGEDIVRNLELSTVKTSDVAIITIPMEEYSKDFLKTMLHTILTGIYVQMETSQEEVNGFIRTIIHDGKDMHQIVLYETIPGGVGYLEKIQGYWCDIIQKAHEVLYNHECDRACYRCLKNYYNQRDHEFLDKSLVKETLENILQECPKLTSKTTRPVSFDSKLEEKFYEIFDKYGIVHPTKDHYVIKDEDGGFIANADFAYPEKKIAIFIDGKKYHQDIPEQADKDRAITNKLQAMGWTVFRFTNTDLKNDADVASTLQTALNRRR